jgi:oligopeptidase B
MTDPSAQQPPVAERDPKVSVLHGEERVDEYHWLRNRDDPRVVAYLEAENLYAEARTAKTKSLRERLFVEMKGRIKQDDSSVPQRKGEYLYYSRTEDGKQYRIECRKKGDLDAPEEILLDQNELAKGHDYFRLGAFEVSPDHALLAYATDVSGNETFDVRVKDLRTGKLLPDVIEKVEYGLEWGNDNRTLYYTTMDEAHRPDKVHRHRLGETRNSEVFHEPDDAFHLRLSKTRSDKFLVIQLQSQITSEVWVLDADDAAAKPRRIEARRNGVEYAIAHHGKRFFIVTNDDAENFRLMEAPVTKPGRAQWREVIGHRPEVRLESAEAFAGHLVLREREEGLRRLRIRDLDTGKDHHVDFEEPVYAVYGARNPEFDTTTLRFRYASLTTPMSVFDYDMSSRKRDLRKEDEVLGGYDRRKYRAERLHATAADGTRVPISLVYREDTPRDGTAPLLLYGYGSYGSTIEPSFNSNRLSLIDRGFVYAIAHVRGGGALGRPWYRAGKLKKKRNTFTDFIACAEHLVDEGYTSKERLAIRGGSAGGLLMGAVTNMRPDLFHVVVANVPFVDVINTMLDDSIPLTVIEYEEWGNPNEKEAYHYIKTYSPYDNVAAVDYPNILVTAGLNDPRVAYWEPAKWVARLRAHKTDRNLLLLKTNMGAGHGGSSGRYDRLEEIAFEYAFILERMGLAE